MTTISDRSARAAKPGRLLVSLSLASDTRQRRETLVVFTLPPRGT